MGKSAPSPPPAPDPSVVASAQGAANTNTAIAQGILNKTNQVTPYGNLTYTQTGTGDAGGTSVPQYTATTTLAPDQQAALDQSNQLTRSLYGIANDQTGRINSAVGQPFDISKAPAMPGSPISVNQDVTNALYGQATSRLDPQFQQQEQQMKDQLAEQGLAPGSAAYSQAIDNFNRTKNDAYTSALNAATSTGAQLGAQDYGLALTGRQQGIQEQSFLREQPLNEAIALMGGGQIQNPNFVQTPQTAIAPTDVLGAYGLNQAAQNAGYQGRVNAATSGNSALAGLGGSLGSAALLGLI